MKSLVKNCPTHGLTTWMVILTFYAGLNFTSRNLLDSTAGGTFMSTKLGATTKLLDEMMINYSQWHTERSPTGKKVNYVEEVSSLNQKAFNKSEEDKLDKLDSLSLKVDNIAHDVEILEIRTSRGEENYTFLQRMAKDPHTISLNIAFTEHITNALHNAREDKLKLEV